MELALDGDLTKLERPVTVDELMQLPEGTPEYELFDGEVIEVSPATTTHAVIVRGLFLRLCEACPPGLDVLFAPVGWKAGTYELYEPDVLVVRSELIGGHLVEEPPALCVEVLSPSNRRHDLIRKRRAYERAGVASYWMVDPNPPAGGDTPRLLALNLVDGSFVEVADARGDIPVELALPYPVTVVPSELTR